MRFGFGPWKRDASSRHRFSVLIVDEQATYRELLRRFLTASGFGEFRFHEVADGAAALRRFNPRSVDLVILNHATAGVHGIEVAKRMRAASGSRHIPIIIISVDGRIGVLEDAMDIAKADGFLRKPFSFQEFKDCLKPVLESRAVS
jgi:CheY-like chemotaxis protein